MTRVRTCVILGHNRQDMLDDCLNAICSQVDHILVIDNASFPELVTPDDECIDLHYIEDQPPNLARLWNYGLDYFAKQYQGQEWDVAVLCDDALPPRGWFRAVTDAMRDTGAIIGCSNPWNSAHDYIVKRGYDTDIHHRMPGWAWVMDGTRLIHADERMHWWWFDTDLDFKARQAGGMVMIGGFGVPNQRPNDFTVSKPELQGRAAEDGQVFASIWGSRPW